MSRLLTNLTRTGLAAWMLLISASFGTGTILDAPAAARPDSLVADPPEAEPLRGEVRLRRLHLVRPDLIPYPIAVEVYC